MDTKIVKPSIEREDDAVSVEGGAARRRVVAGNVSACSVDLSTDIRERLAPYGQFVQSEVQFQHIDSGFTQEAKIPLVGMLLHQLA